MSSFSRSRVSLGKRDFPEIFKKNKRSVDRLFIVLGRSNDRLASRLGLAISKKHLARAVDRNRVKRLIRESFYQHQPFSIPFDAVVINRSGLRQCSNQKIRESLADHWQQVARKLKQV